MTSLTPSDPLDGIPLPPPEMWSELIAGDAGTASETTPETASSPAPAAKVAPEVAALDFIGDALPLVTIHLHYPFRLDGVDVREITVRRLTVAQLGAFWEGLPDDGTFDRTDVYGVMCGLPGRVIRALPDVDGMAVTDVCFNFLPPALGGASA